MKEKLRFVALRTIKVNDKSSILNAYSLEHGRVALVLSASAGREARRRRALVMPLSLVECQAEARPCRDLYIMAEPRPLATLEKLYGNPVKNAVAMFLAEFLNIVLRDTACDAPRFRFIAESIVRLAESPLPKAANFHIYFLLKFGLFMGIEPDFATYGDGRVFDMADGVFKRPVDIAPSHPALTLGESELLHSLRRLDFDNLHRWRFNHVERRELIARMLDYYALHCTSAVGAIKSFDVLRTLF